MTLLENKGGGLGSIGAPVPPRVDAETQQSLLDVLRQAVGQGGPLVKAFGVLGLDVRRARCWTCRADRGAGLDDPSPGASVIALMPDGVEGIVSSHQRLDCRGSYENLCWTAPLTVRRVLNDHHLRFRHPPRPLSGQRRPFPDWASCFPSCTRLSGW